MVENYKSNSINSISNLKSQISNYLGPIAGGALVKLLYYCDFSKGNAIHRFSGCILYYWLQWDSLFSGV